MESFVSFLQFAKQRALAIFFFLLLYPHKNFFLTIAEETSSSCTIFLAESSIKNGGFGVFAGRDFQVGEHIGEGGLGIPLLDLDDAAFEKEMILDFGWTPFVVGGHGEADKVFTLLPGAGMLTNFHPMLSNVITGGLKNDNIFDRAKDPGAGASTSYHDFKFISAKHVKAGQELFADIDDTWFTDRENESEGYVTPLGVEYEYADGILKDLAKYKKNHPTMGDSVFLDIVLRVKNEMLRDFASIKILIPDTIDGVLKGAEKGTARNLLNEHSLEWIKENGKCLDNLRAGVSTITGAGRGAFATRFIPKGSIIAPCPLVHIMDKTKLLMSSNKNDHTNEKYQLLLNYCFGHKKSSLLLCPTTSVSLINHSKEGANAAYQWAQSSENQKRKMHYTMGPLEDLQTNSSSYAEQNTKLSFDFIATRDIYEGEEVFIDYGEEWVNAWNTHVENWKKDDSAKNYIPASVMNAKQANIQPTHKSTGNYRHYSYLCQLEPFARDEGPEFEEDAPEEDYHASRSLDKDTWDVETSMFYSKNEYIWSWPCEVELANEDNTLFTVRVFKRAPINPKERPAIRLLKNFPRKSIKFVDKPYHSDQHLKNTFRYYIPIPDGLFPLHWRDDYISAEEVKLGVKDHGDAFHHDAQLAYREQLRNAKCGIYMAPSTIPNAGKGIYAGVTLPSKDINMGARTPVIPVDERYFNKWGKWDGHDYVWDSFVFLAEFEGEDVRVVTPNAGCMSNFHPGLVNMDLNEVTHKPILDRSVDPGAGAFSDYWDFSFRSHYRIEAGEEIFISYGENWFQGREGYLGRVPLSLNYKEANEIVSSVVGLVSGQGSNLNENEAMDLMEIIKRDILVDDRTKVIFKSLKTLDDVKEVMVKNGTAETTTEKRSIEWLEENGQCIDHIYVKNSTIPQAGRGAFARRPIRSGETIIPSPMINTWGRDLFNMSEEDLLKGINRKQLVYNYMWSHPESSLLLLPINAAVTINHASERGEKGRGPNAELKWSKTDKKSMYYQQSRLDELKKEHHSTMVLDFVATRDIMPDEEILIDYGEEWENAWNLHVENYHSLCDRQVHACSNSSMSVSLMNENKFNIQYHSWENNHFTLCKGDAMPKDPESIDDYSTHGINYDHYGFKLAATVDEWHPCLILDSDEEKNTFDVVFFTNEDPKSFPEKAGLRRARSIKPDDIRFLDKPYKSDHHWSGGFRHEMKIPDHVFPPQWKDLSKS